MNTIMTSYCLNFFSNNEHRHTYRKHSRFAKLRNEYFTAKARNWAFCKLIEHFARLPISTNPSSPYLNELASKEKQNTLGQFTN